MGAVAEKFKEMGAGQVDELVYDLSDLVSVRSCATEMLALPVNRTIDALLLNAGMASLEHKTTTTGVDLVMMANHLGHFLLTGLIFDRLATGARIVTMSSLVHQIKDGIPWEDVASGKKLKDAYAFAKAANLLFVEELNRRLVEKNSSIIAVAAHPGLSLTEFGTKVGTGIQQKLMMYILKTMGQPVAHGAWPLLMAATDSEISRDCYYAPSKALFAIKEFCGPPKRNGGKTKTINEKTALQKARRSPISNSTFEKLYYCRFGL